MNTVTVKLDTPCTAGARIASSRVIHLQDTYIDVLQKAEIQDKIQSGYTKAISTFFTKSSKKCKKSDPFLGP